MMTEQQIAAALEGKFYVFDCVTGGVYDRNDESKPVNVENDDLLPDESYRPQVKPGSRFQTRHSPETIKAVLAYRGKLSASEIGMKLDLSRNSVISIWNRYAITPISKEERQAIFKRRRFA